MHRLRAESQSSRDCSSCGLQDPAVMLLDIISCPAALMSLSQLYALATLKGAYSLNTQIAREDFDCVQYYRQEARVKETEPG